MKYKIAVVDDSPLIRALVCDIAEDLGLNLVGEASTVEEGIELCVDKKPNVVILDINMPSEDNQKSGIEVLEVIKEKCPITKVIMLTAVGEKASIIQAIKKGANDYIAKPFDERKLKASLEKVLKTKFD